VKQAIGKTFKLMMAFFFLALVVSTPLSATTPSTKFQVVFDGIIVHDLRHNLALVVHGGAMKMRHAPLLIVPADINVAELRDATAQPVFCDADNCHVLIDRFDIRIGTDDPKRTPIPMKTPDASFNNVPHLLCVTKRELLQRVAGDLPEGPVAGRFDLVEGTLSSAITKDKGSFLPDYCQLGMPYFSGNVSLDGDLDPGQSPRLQIRSAATLGEWVVIDRDNTDPPLKITIKNHGTRMGHSSRHFALLATLLAESTDSFPIVCPEKINPGDDVDKVCKPPTTSVNDPFHTEEYLPGCANSTWP
jgi:hypothetical protein